MNIRKNVDYSDMYAVLERIMAADMPQMKLYCEIGKAVSQRTEKGAAVAAAEFLAKKCPDAQGFSPRNLRRMRDFYRAYENDPQMLSLALQLGWTQNVVILEAGLPMELRGWYLKAVKQFGWSKTELNKRIKENAHERIKLITISNGQCMIKHNSHYIYENRKITFMNGIAFCSIQRFPLSYKRWWKCTKKEKRRRILLLTIFMNEHVAII